MKMITPTHSFLFHHLSIWSPLSKKGHLTIVFENNKTIVLLLIFLTIHMANWIILLTMGDMLLDTNTPSQ